MTSDSDRHPVDVLAEEFVQRRRAGQTPSLTEYTRRHPEWADEIREVFPALVEIENVRPTTGEQAAVGLADATVETTRPDRLGDFRLIREIGRGGMGIVYEAEQISLGRRVALKLLAHQAHFDPRQKKRFEREARAAARLHHTNIVPVFGVGEHDGTLYYVMQFIDGLGLDEVLLELKRLHQRPVSEGASLAGGAAELARSMMPGALAPTIVAPADGGPPPAEADLTHDTSAPQLADTRGDTSSFALPAVPTDRRHAGTASYPASVARIGVGVARALEHAHSQGVLHRDIKPANLLLDTAGGVWVTDFGLAKTVEQDHLTHTGDILGTLRYMAPETFSGQADSTSDIYSLGLTLYEMLALRPAFDETERSRLVRQVMDGHLRPLRRVNPEVPRDLETIVHKATEHGPQARYQSAGDLAEDLERFLRDEPIRARRVWWHERLARWCRRNPLAASLSGMIAVILVAVAVVALLAAGQYKDVADDRRIALDDAQAARANALVARDAARDAQRREAALRQQSDAMAEGRRQQLYAAHVQLAYREFEAANLEHVRELLEGLAPPEGKRDLRGFEWYHLWRMCHAERQTLSGHDAPVRTVAFSADGTTLATGGGNSVVLWDAATGQPRARLHPGIHEVWSLSFSPDGQTLAIAGHEGRDRGRVFLADIAQRNVRVALPVFEHAVLAVAFSPDGRRIATGTARYWGQGGTPGTRLVWISPGTQPDEVVLWDAESGERQAALPGPTGGILSLAWSPDGKLLAAGSWDAALHLWDVDQRAPLEALRPHRGSIWDVAFSPDGRILASGGGRWDGEPEVKLWTLRSDHLENTDASEAAGESGLSASRPLLRLRTTLRGHSAGVTALAFSPDGATLATASWDRTARLWDVASGTERAVVAGHESYLLAVAFSPDGQLFSTGSWDETARLWYSAQRLDETTLTTDDVAGAYSIAFSPDGRRLATSAGDASVIELATGRIVARLKGHSSDTIVAWSPNGRFLATAGIDGTAKIWNAQTWTLRHHLDSYQSRTWSIAFSRDSRLLATGSQDGQVRLWNVESGERVGSLAGSGGAIRSLAFSADGRWLAGCCHQTPEATATDVKVWDLASREVIHVIGPGDPGAHTNFVECVAFSSDAHFLATCSHDRTASVWDTSTWQLRTAMKGHQEGVYHLAISPDDRTLATASWDGTVRLWSTDAGQLLATLGRNTGVVYAVAFSPDGRTLSSGHRGILGAGSRQVKLWHAAAPNEIIARPGQGQGQDDDDRIRAILPGTFKNAPTLAWPPGGPLFSAESHGSVLAHQPGEPAAARVIAPAVDEVRSLAVSPDGNRIVIVNPDGSAWLWTALGDGVPGGDRLQSVAPAPPADPEAPPPPVELLPGHGQLLHAAVFSRDGSLLALTGAAGTVVLLDGATGEKLRMLHGAEGVISSVAFSPDGGTLAVGSWDRTVRIWDTASGKLLRTLGGPAWGVVSLAFSPDGRLLAAGGGFGGPAIHIWSATTGAEYAAFEGHSDEITDLVFTPGGRTLLSAAWDGTVRLWDIPGRKAIGILTGGHSRLALSPDGATFATSSADRRIRVWDLAAVRSSVRPPSAPALRRVIRPSESDDAPRPQKEPTFWQRLWQGVRQRAEQTLGRNDPQIPATWSDRLPLTTNH